MTTFGVHIGLQDTTPADVLAVATEAEALGFDWVSTWDHFFSVSPDSKTGGSLEGVSILAAVAMATQRVRVGTLVFSTSYRHPAVIAKAAASIDHISGGRVEIGLGAGFSQTEHKAFGFPLRPLRQRMDAFDEAVRCITGLLHTDTVTFAGEYFQLRDARCTPPPVQAHLPVWVGGRGERRTLRIAAAYADGWNSAFLPPNEVARKLAVLHEHCHALDRDPDALAISANVGVGLTDAMLEHHHRTLGDPGRTRSAAAVTGVGQELTDQIARYIDAGVDQINFTLRAPFHREALPVLAEAIQALRR